MAFANVVICYSTAARVSRQSDNGVRRLIVAPNSPHTNACTPNVLQVSAAAVETRSSPPALDPTHSQKPSHLAEAHVPCIAASDHSVKMKPPHFPDNHSRNPDCY
jgi:hypothetical protein